MDFLNSKPLKVAVVFLAVMSVVLIAGAAVSRWQHAREGVSNLTKTLMSNGAPLPPLPQTDFYGYPVSPPLSSCVGTRLEERSFRDKIKSFFASKKKLIEKTVVLCEAEEARATKEWKKRKQQEALVLEREEEEKRANKVTLEDLPVVELPPFTVNWLPVPEKLDDISLLDTSSYDSVSYFKMGRTSYGDDVIYSSGEAVMMGADIGRWVKILDGKFVLLEKQSTLTQSANSIFDSVAAVAGKLARDSRSEISGIDAPNEFEYLKTRWIRQGGIFASDITPLNIESKKPSRDLAQLSFGELFSVEKKNETNNSIGSVSYFVRIADGFYLNYKMDDSRADDGTLLADWKSKYENFKKMSFTGGSTNGGCGTAGDNRYYPKSGEIENLEKIGTLKTGNPLYLVGDLNNAAAETFYSEYSRLFSYGDASPMSRADFFRHIKVLLSPDPLGQGYLFYKYIDDNSLIQAAECAKPVIYLYPERTTDVSVKVGANITKSEPEYGSGWKVTAEPNGTLRDGSGKEWQSLFWDGTGYGEYPAIREGKVVLRSNIREALEGDLRGLGLNDRERADFLEFWLPHMPNTQYVRLTWLTTSEMNRLAPLAVFPRPETVIRVFLDFAGQESSETDLKPQILSAVPRKGFTLIEWGGLLHSSKNIQ